MTSREIYTTIIEVKKEIETHMPILQKQLSQYDSQEQDLLHGLELETCDAVAMVKIAKDLKALRIARREIKTELTWLGSMNQTVKLTEDKKFTDKTYTYKTDALIQIKNKAKGQKI